MKMVFAVLLVCLLAGAAVAIGQPGVATDARTESGGLRPVNDQLAPPTRSGGGPPGADQIIYDDGHLATAFYFFAKDVRYAVRMDPAYHPAIVAQCDIHVLTNGDPFWPWPDSHHDSICVQVWLDPDGDGMPDLQESWSQWVQSEGVPSDSATITVRPPLGAVICSTGSFWVGMMNDTLAAGYEGVGIDGVADHPDHYYSYGPPADSWGHGMFFFPGDVMFRAWTIQQGARGIVAEVTSPVGTVSLGDSAAPCASIANLGAGADSAWVWMRIEHTCSTDDYLDSCWVRLDPLQTLDTTYRAWTPLYPGVYRIQCSCLRNDTNWTYLTVLPRTGLEQGRLLPSLARNRIEVGPNPVRAAVEIRYSVAGNSWVALRILDVRGIVVRTLVAGSSSPGEHLAVWDTHDDQGRTTARGIYFVRLESQDCQETRKVILAR